MNHTRNGKDDRTCCPAIEFIGGPYDGHKEVCRTQTVHLPTDLAWIVCEDAFRMLEGRDSHPGGAGKGAGKGTPKVPSTVRQGEKRLAVVGQSRK